jgi:hypothetical protein
MQIPQTLTAGDLWGWTDTLTDYPATVWVLYYYFAGPKAFSITGTASGSDHVLAYLAASSTDYPRGTYQWRARVVKIADTTNKVSVATGRLSLLPNLANLATDNRSHEQKVLDALEAVIQNRATTDQQSYSVAGRSISRMTWDELHAAYDRYKLIVAKQSGLHPSRVLIRTGLA